MELCLFMENTSSSNSSLFKNESKIRMLFKQSFYRQKLAVNPFFAVYAKAIAGSKRNKTSKFTKMY